MKTHFSKRKGSVRAIVCMAVVSLVAVLAAAAPSAQAQGIGDFQSGSGPESIRFAVPAASEDIGSQSNAGMVTVLAVSESGSAKGTKALFQSRAGVPGVSEPGDNFGGATVWGDFDNNGIDDLAVGVPKEGVGTAAEAGMVTVFYDARRAEGFSSAVNLHQARPGVPSLNESGDFWGAALDAGDLNGDGYDDLVVGAPGEDIGSTVNAGAITVLYGTSDGISPVGALSFWQESHGVIGGSETDDRWGSSVAVVGSGGPGSTWVAVGAPGEGVAFARQGAVTVFEATSTGLAALDYLIYQGAGGVSRGAVAQSSDLFGYRLSGSESGILAVGSPADNNYDGSVLVAWDLGNTLQTRWHPGTSNSAQWYGASVDVEGTDLLIGIPYDGRGAFEIISNVQNSNGGTIFQSMAGLAFGLHVDIHEDGEAFLVAAPSDEGDGPAASGSVHVFLGDPAQIGPDGIHVLSQDSPFVPGGSELGDHWGRPYFGPLPLS